MPEFDLDPSLRRAQEEELLQRARASAVRCRRATLSHFPAGVRLGMPTYGSLGRPCLTVASGTALRHLADAHLHRANLPADHLVRVGEDDVTCPARTVLDIAREHGVEAGVVAADHALHEGLATRYQLSAAYEACAYWPGRSRARITLLAADAAAESPLESVSRLRIIAAGLPSPTLQAEICDADGRYITRCDFLWDEFGVVGEADGLAKYALNAGAALRERATEKALERTGLIVVRWGWADLYAFDDVVRRLELEFARAARTDSSARRWGVLLPRPGLHP